ncbi:MAG: hypothetical protein AABX82_06535 [Nanoarchaeota archaeon]
MLSKKDIIEINKTFHTGKLSNESSLDFALNQVYRSKNWLKTAAILSRAILIDHVFEDGNKRTAAGTIMTIMEMNKIAFAPTKIDTIVIEITKKNITQIKEVEKVIIRGRE